MVDERDISREREWFYEERARTVVANLQKRNMNAQYVSSRQEALSTILDTIPVGATVFVADSVTLAQVGIIPELKKRGQNKVIEAAERDAEGFFVVTGEERERLRREVFFSDIYIAGTNAVTIDGKLVNTDGHGNRVSPMIFGPKKVIVVAGVNKIVQDVNEALERIHNFAAPMVAKRHILKHHMPELGDLPCVRTGSCADCRHDWRICNYTVITEGAFPWTKGWINVVLVGEELGI